jgi:glucan phosphoethanolaminetransferase (alkaline phosphatase superfamily)
LESIVYFILKKTKKISFFLFLDIIILLKLNKKKYMNKFIKFFAVILLFLFTINTSSATFFKSSTKKIENGNIDIKKLEAEIKLLISEENYISYDLDKLDETPIKLNDVFESFA